MIEAVVCACFSLPASVEVEKHKGIHTTLTTKDSVVRVAQSQQSEGRHLGSISQHEDCEMHF